MTEHQSLRFVGEALNARVDWDGENEVVTILTSAPIGALDYDVAKKQLDSAIAVLPVDGMWSEPFGIPLTEGISFIVLKDRSAFDTFNNLSEQDRGNYINFNYKDFYLLPPSEQVTSKSGD